LVLDTAGYLPHSTTSTVTPTPFHVCFDCRLGCLRQGYQSHGCTGLTISGPLLPLCKSQAHNPFFFFAAVNYMPITG
jgi:hypothetical protein